MKFLKVLVAVFSLALGVVPFTEAALPTAAATAFTTIQTDILALVDLAWPLMIAVTIAFIIMRLFKKSANAAV
ncbi:major coat protein [Methylomonas koyamae]|uniref:major coat protein n=1 Tax=Methylomonas koyamae TaxID=702114 RepID=UPI00112DEBE9|nr:major coat protein [Methylomonas koyamae]TPQ24992.1 phage coat protein [Methylomonas koyamae]